jgi:poly(A) polymerase
MVDRLPDAAWTQRTDLAALIAALGPGNARFVGGAVRDTLLGMPVKDVDIATPLEPRDVMSRLGEAGIRAIATGIEHGTITAALDQGPVEITTLRRDISTDGRRATVAFSSDWRDDAARRDFTINALYADPATREISDWFGGLEDLKARRVRFIGDPRQRIREDHLRILRYFRFRARFGSQSSDEESENACAELAGMLKGLSRERIGMEMMNLLGLADPAATVARMAELGVLAQVLPEADPAALARLVAWESRQGIAPDALRRLAALLPADVTLAEKVAARFRLSGAQKKRLAAAAGRTADPGPPRPLAYRLGREQALDRLLLAGADTAPLRDWAIPVLPIKGGDIVAAGVSAGPQVARILCAVEDQWVAELFPGEDRVREILAEVLAR